MNTGIDRIREFLCLGYEVYIYGTGLWGRNVYHELEKHKIHVTGFAVTQREQLKKLFDLPILQFHELDAKRTVLVLGLNQHNTKEVVRLLEESDFDSHRIFRLNDILKVNDVRCGYDEMPCIDITTKIGCSINCRYCPQKTLLNAYYKYNPGREQYLTADTLKRCMDHLPNNVNYQFGGMAEAFLNPNCLDLLRMVCDTGHVVNLYTTLVGLDEDMLYQIIDLPIEYVTLHVADAKGYAKISTTEEYYHLLEVAVNAKKGMEICL